MTDREAVFLEKLARTGLWQLPGLLQALPDETARLARLCYAASPAGDWLDTPPEVFFSCAAHARYLRENVSWTRALPEPLFLAYVLHPRVNNEALCDCRPVFYAALAERLRGLPEEAAILEINRWCAEHVAYQPTDERTRSALAVLRAGFGRCGEESMFAVNVLRACGFAARQVYVPRWAHCDDNHAWVEVRCGGAWHFLGACEPEAVLDRGWFNSAAGRAVLVHSRCFGEPEPGADLIGREGDVVYCNETARYADVRRLTVRVTDENGMSAAGADVDFCILNNCEWYPAATVQTDASGMAALTCGLGSLRLLAQRGGLCCEAFVSPEETGPVVLTLGKRAPAPDRWEPIELTAPRGGAVRGAVPTEAQRDLQERWLRQAHEAWTQRREARLDEADAQGLPPEETALLRAGAGHAAQLAAFLREEPEAMPLLRTLLPKDLLDIAPDVLRDTWAHTPRPDGVPEGIWAAFVLCPRVGYEQLLPQRRELTTYFSEERSAVFRRDPAALWAWLTETIAPSTLSPSPLAALTLRQASPEAKRVLFAALCRALGVPARLAPEDGAAEYWQNGVWKRTEGRDTRGTVVLICPAGEKWVCGVDFSLSALTPDGARLLWPAADGLTFSAAPGDYCLLTTNRLPNGDQRVLRRHFSLAAGERRTLRLKRAHAALAEMLGSHAMEDFFSARTMAGEPVSGAALTAHGGLLMWLAPGQEPTEHLLRELLDEDLQGVPLTLLVPDAGSLRNETLRRFCEKNPDVPVLLDGDARTAETAARQTFAEAGKLPLLVVLRGPLTAAYAVSGYHVGSAALALRVWQAVRP